MESTGVFHGCQLVPQDKDQHCGGHKWATPPAQPKPDPVNPSCAELEKPLTTVTPAAQEELYILPKQVLKSSHCSTPGAVQAPLPPQTLAAPLIQAGLST